MQDKDGRPVLFIMNLQEAVVTRPAPRQSHPPAHLASLTERIYDYAAAARASGVQIVWLFHCHKEGQAKANPRVWEDFAAARQALDGAGDAPLKDLPVAAGDRFWVLPAYADIREESFSNDLERLGVSRDAAVAGCGFEHEAPGADATYFWAHALAARGLHPAILDDLTDNRLPQAEDGAAQRNLAFLKALHAGRIAWVAGRFWLAAAGGLPPAPEGRRAAVAALVQGCAKALAAAPPVSAKMSSRLAATAGPIIPFFRNALAAVCGFPPRPPFGLVPCRVTHGAAYGAAHGTAHSRGHRPCAPGL